MINFQDLTIQKTPVEAKRENILKGRYVIGIDPFEIASESKSNELNVIVIYDKACMKITTKVETTKTFDKWVEDFTKLFTEAERRMYIVSHKFINSDGTIKSRDQIGRENNRNENEIRNISPFQGHTTALQSQCGI